jgi:PAS domain S-box-containing protein
MPPAANPPLEKLLLPASAVVLAYAVTGWSGLIFAVPPGYASPFFPAAGVALAAVLVYGPRMAWAVLLGSFAMNAVLASQRGAVGWAAWGLPALIAGGATLQALAAVWLVRRRLRTPVTLDSPRTIACFFGLTAALACVVSPTVGSLALWAGGALLRQELPLTWLVWWGGDALGVVIAAPVVLSLIGQPRDAWRTRRSSVAVPLVLATLLLAVAVSQVVRWQEQRSVARFERDAENTSRTFELRLRAHVDALDAMHGVYVASDEVTGREFRLASQAWLDKLPSLQAVGWHQRVEADDLPAFERGVRAEGVPGYRVFDRDAALTAGDTEVLALRHIEPQAGNAAALGVNSLSVQASRDAIVQARRSGAATATAGFRLTQESGDQLGVVIYRPVYAEGKPGEPASAGRLQGLVFITLRMDDALRTLAAGSLDYIEVCLFETAADGSVQRLAGPADCTPGRPGATLLRTTAIAFAGRPWELQVRALAPVPSESAGPLASDSGSTWIFALAGLCATGLMGALLLIVTGRARRTEAAVAERTLQLQHEIAERQATEQALRDSERRFRSIFNSVPLGVIYTDLRGGIKQPNASFAAMTGYSEEELLDTTTPALTHPDDLAEDQRLRDALARGEQQLVRRRKRLITRDGRVLWVDATMTLQHDPRGGPQRLVALIEDISEHLRLEEAERARESAEASNQAKSEFLSRMSHELRTPLNAMLGFSQLLELDAEPRLNARHAQWVAQIRRAGWHLLEMINDVLDLSRIESGTLKLEQLPLRIEPLLVESLALVEAQAREREVRLVRGPSEDPGLRVLGDATRIKQILTNLLSNAVKYNRHGGEVVLAIRRRRLEAGSGIDADGDGDDAGMLDVEVRDTGLGMNPEQLAQLFQPFNRLGRERGGAEGTGIGLVITKLLAERLGGALSVRSTEGIGSVFTLSLPLAGHVAAATEPASLDDTGGGYHARHVLYIEDNEINVEVMRGIFLQRPQVRLDIATTGLDGLAAVRTAPPDLILLDMHLPDIDGMALLQHLQSDERTAGIPVIVVSADALPAQTQAALEAGAARYVTKPVSVDEMLVVIDEQLSQLTTRFG